MSRNSNRTETESIESRLSASRREFLAISGVAALGVLGSTSVNARESGPSGPGRIPNLSAYLEDPGVFQEHREPTHTPTTVPYEPATQAMESDVPFTELEERDSIGFNLDHAVTGVGGTPAATPAEHQVQPEPTEFTVTLCPITDGDDPMTVTNRRLPTE